MFLLLCLVLLVASIVTGIYAYQQFGHWPGSLEISLIDFSEVHSQVTA